MFDIYHGGAMLHKILVTRHSIAPWNSCACVQKLLHGLVWAARHDASLSCHDISQQIMICSA